MAKIDQSIEWKNRVDACRSSGLSIRKWCEDHQVKYSQFYYWWKKFNGMDKQSSCQWLPVVLSNEKEEPSSLLVHVGDATLEIHPPFDPVLFQQVMKALNER